jgi:hypothetical protein
MCPTRPSLRSSGDTVWIANRKVDIKINDLNASLYALKSLNFLSSQQLSFNDLNAGRQLVQALRARLDPRGCTQRQVGDLRTCAAFWALRVDKWCLVPHVPADGRGPGIDRFN